MRKVLLPIISLALMSCSAAYGGTDNGVASKPIPMELTCDAAAAQGHVGHDATQAMGAAILQESGARRLRWGPPNSVWTMDYRKDRVNVRYDADMIITAISCG